MASSSRSSQLFAQGSSVSDPGGGPGRNEKHEVERTVFASCAGRPHGVQRRACPAAVCSANRGGSLHHLLGYPCFRLSSLGALLPPSEANVETSRDKTKHPSAVEPKTRRVVQAQSDEICMYCQEKDKKRPGSASVWFLARTKDQPNPPTLLCALASARRR